MSISDQLREKNAASGKSLKAIERESGVPQPMMTRFVNGFDIRLMTADKLAEYFGLELQPRKKKRRKPKKKKAAPKRRR